MKTRSTGVLTCQACRAPTLMWLFFFVVPPATAQSLRIYHIDVEQADATLFVSPSGKTLLVDSGKNGHGSRIKAVMDEASVTGIDFFVNTHYHEDHYGGIDDLVNMGITISKAFDRGDKDELSSTKKNEPTFQDYQTAVGNQAEQLSRGEQIALDPEIVVTCVASGGMINGEQNPTPGVDENDMSLALLVEFGHFKYFVGGDIELTTEGKLAQSDAVLDVDVYQANHHGSHTSSSLPFVTDLSPTVVIISNGNHGGFQHPRQHTLNILAGLTPKPTVFQTNKYLKGGAGGNVADDFIADVESTDTDGTILVTVNAAADQYVVSYSEETHTFSVKTPSLPTADVVIESVLPNPFGNDRQLEEITLKNKSSAVVHLNGWSLRDKDNHIMDLSGHGSIATSQSLKILRNGSPFSLNNNGDTVKLLGPNNEEFDIFTYAGSSEGQVIETGH